MGESFLLAVGGLALVDGLNPSALVVALYLLTQERPASKVTVYMAGVFLTYLAVGILLMMGVDAALVRVGEAVSGPTAYLIQGGVGAALLTYAITADPKKGSSHLARIPAGAGIAALFALGGIITVLELTSAFPLFGAVGILTSQQLPVYQWLPILVGYTLIFVLPPFVLLGLHQVLGSWMADRMSSWQEKLQRAGNETLLWILGFIGFGLLADAVKSLGWLKRLLG